MGVFIKTNRKQRCKDGDAKRIMQEVDKLPIHKFIQNKEDEHDEHDET